MGPWTGAGRGAPAHAAASGGASATPHPLQLRGEPAPLEQCQERFRSAPLDHFTWTAPCDVPASSFSQRYYVCARVRAALPLATRTCQAMCECQAAGHRPPVQRPRPPGIRARSTPLNARAHTHAVLETQRAHLLLRRQRGRRPAVSSRGGQQLQRAPPRPPPHSPPRRPRLKAHAHAGAAREGGAPAKRMAHAPAVPTCGAPPPTPNPRPPRPLPCPVPHPPTHTKVFEPHRAHV